MCDGTELTAARLGPQGTVWSFTDVRYQPPPPYIPPTEPHDPYVLLAVEVDGSSLVILGQAVAGTSIDGLRVGDRVELVIDVLSSDTEHEYVIWKWRPVEVNGG
jgi:uncharacterized OB-fold protein